MEQKYQGTLRERKAQASLDYYYRHKKKILKLRKSHYKRNRQRILSEIHSRKIACPQCGKSMRPESKLCYVCSHTRIYSGTLQERKNAAVAAWRARNPEKQPEYTRDWNRRNPIKRREYRRNGDRVRRARKNRAIGKYTESEWLDLCRKYDYRCLCCREQKPLTQDHIVPLSKGGQNCIDNIQPLCKSCNSKKGTKTIDYRGLIS